MTRFARAKGSKSSNERVPEEATTWQEMKNQLELKQKEVKDNKKRKELEVVRQENYDKFVESVENEKANKTVWSEFPHELKKSKRSKHIPDQVDSAEANNKPAEEIHVKKTKTSKKKISEVESDELPPKKEKGLKRKHVEMDENGLDDDAPEEVSAKLQSAPETPAKKNKKKSTKNKPLVIPKVDAENTEENTIKASKSKKKDWSHMSEEEIQKRMDKKRAQRQKRSEKMREKKKLIAETSGQPAKETKPPKEKLTRKDKIEKQVEFKRRKPEANSAPILHINGQKVELVLFNGYPIQKEDAKRLTELKKKMISKGIPRSEVERTLKLERRKCEKAVTRMKRNLCFNCRKSGHVLSECPKLENKQTTATGICFKCGSTEHTHFECKVVRTLDYKFAECFICKEQGHIARQCPENPRGMYPKGGACKLCGDVTHFKKDCPTLQLADGEANSGLSVGIMDDSASAEGLGDENKKTAAAEKKRNVKKIKF